MRTCSGRFTCSNERPWSGKRMLDALLPAPRGFTPRHGNRVARDSGTLKGCQRHASSPYSANMLLGAVTLALWCGMAVTPSSKRATFLSVQCGSAGRTHTERMAFFFSKAGQVMRELAACYHGVGEGCLPHCPHAYLCSTTLCTLHPGAHARMHKRALARQPVHTQ